MPRFQMYRPAVLLLLAMVSGVVPAANDSIVEQAVVHAVQPPAWIEREGGIVPLRPGDPLLPGDMIRTGPGGRVHADLPEGSRVKLGEAVRFQVERMRESSDSEGSFFDAAFNVLKGAFRFTTGLAGNERRRDVTFRVGVVTAGIRGTDIWGKSADDGSDMVLLLEGEVELAMPGHDAMMLSQSAHGVMMMPSGEMRMLQAMPTPVIQQYARETEMNDASAMMMENGKWQLVVMSLQNNDIALRVQQQLAKAGYPVEIEPVTLNGTGWHRVVLNHLASANDARMQGEALIGRFGIRDFWSRIKHR